MPHSLERVCGRIWMQPERMMLYFAVILALAGTVSCQYYGTGTNSGSCAVTATSLGCANYRVLTLASKNSNFMRVNPDGSFSGFAWDLLNALKATMDFNFTLSNQADGVYGGQDGNGVWNGLVGGLVRNETDIVIAALAIASERLMAIDFTVPFMTGYIFILSQSNASLSGIKYAVRGSSAESAYLMASRESRAREIWASVQANLPASLVPDDDAGLALVQQGGWAYVIRNAPAVLFVKNSNGRLMINRPALHTFYLALGVQLGSPLRIPLSIAVTRIIAKGEVQTLLAKWGLAAPVSSGFLQLL